MPTASLHSNGTSIAVVTGWEDRELIKLIPGTSWDGEHKIWSVPLAWSACLQLRGVFGVKLVIADDLRKWATAERARIEEAQRLSGLLALEDDDHSAIAELVRSWR